MPAAGWEIASRDANSALRGCLAAARDLNIRLILDIKDKSDRRRTYLQVVRREGMLQRVRFGGEWSDVKQLYPHANADAEVWMQPGVTAEQVMASHREGKAVIANFSANDHEMDLAGMKAAVAAGVDGINVDYPRLGADAVGRPVEQKHVCASCAGECRPEQRRERKAILESGAISRLPIAARVRTLATGPGRSRVAGSGSGLGRRPPSNGSCRVCGGASVRTCRRPSERGVGTGQTACSCLYVAASLT